MIQRFNLQNFAWRSLMAAIVMIVATSAHADITIYAYGTSSAPYIQLWNADADVSSYSGKALSATGTTATSSYQWYSVTLSGVNSTSMALTTSSGWNNQTSDITGLTTGTYYFYYEGNGFYLNITDTKDASQFCFFEVNESWWYNDLDATVIDVYTSGSTMVTKAPMTYAGGTKGGNNIYLWADNTTSTPTGVNVYRKVGSSYYNQCQYNAYSLGYVYKGPSNQGYFTKPVTGLTWPEQPIDINTGELYLVGNAAGNPWQANVGIEMTPDGDVFTAENVLLVPGNSGFAFATMLGATANDWATLNSHRYGSKANSSTWLITDSQLGTQLDLQIDTQEKNFVVQNAGYYDIVVNLTNKTVTVTRKYNALYMYYGNSSSPYWKPNGGVSMMTQDGNTYTLSNVELNDGETFQFTKQLGSGENTWPANDKRLGSNAVGASWLVTTAQLEAPISNSLQVGSTKDFVMDQGTGGTYRVVVNLSDNSVALYSMATVLNSKTIIHLEQTANVSDPFLWAYDKERDKADQNYIHVDRPARTTIATARKVLLDGFAPNKDDITTADGRKWWTWELDNSIADFWFTRGDYTPTYRSNNATELANADMTAINWRKAGELYFTWENDTTLDEYTRDYYAAAAQEAADCAVMIEGHLYAYFTNTPGWDHVFCHAWYTDEYGVNHDLLKNDYTTGTSWYPGALCEMVGYDKDGYEVWRIDLTAHGVTTMPAGIIFNNGIDKTGDNEYTDYANNTVTTQVKEQTGDFEYSTGTCYDYCGVIVLGRSLGNIIRNGVVNGPVYTIEEPLEVVYLDRDAKTTINVDGGSQVTVYGALYCKDANNFVTTNYVEKSLQQDGEIDYIGLTGLMGSKTRYDQSNWVKLTLSTQYPGIDQMNQDAQVALLEQYVGKVLPKDAVNAQLVNNYNPEMRLALHALPAANLCANGSYAEDPNIFVTQSFVGSQDIGPLAYGYDPANLKRYFLVTPKPQEFATITWAVYGGNSQFFAPTIQSYQSIGGRIYYMNEADLNGYFPVLWDLMSKPSWMENGVNGNGEHTGQSYKFHAIIRLADETTTTTSANAPRREFMYPSEPYKTNVTTSRYIVSPIDITNTEGGIVTAVQDVKTAKTVTAVRYYNLSGMASEKPFAGMNIVVTDYSDGTRTTQKVIR